jgi:hypothetical protein
VLQGLPPLSSLALQQLTALTALEELQLTPALHMNATTEKLHMKNKVSHLSCQL